MPEKNDVDASNYVIDQKIKSSPDSIARMQKDKQEFEELEAVKEYRFITQKMIDMDADASYSTQPDFQQLA